MAKDLYGLIDQAQFFTWRGRVGRDWNSGDPGWAGIIVLLLGGRGCVTVRRGRESNPPPLALRGFAGSPLRAGGCGQGAADDVRTCVRTCVGACVRGSVRVHGADHACRECFSPDPGSLWSPHAGPSSQQRWRPRACDHKEGAGGRTGARRRQVRPRPGLLPAASRLPVCPAPAGGAAPLPQPSDYRGAGTREDMGEKLQLRLESLLGTEPAVYPWPLPVYFPEFLGRPGFPKGMISGRSLKV
ncbi:uncharacterized protein LOC116764033 [Phocoena sinus]|uniref:uncharacterized protein LOC116764033 n=1 Tax=Phocoena sinus TaxID=42100 RepID=UPI0013C464B3|nr:uncharacterized protein LOC116764033 [Phocoena sinus]